MGYKWLPIKRPAFLVFSLLLIYMVIEVFFIAEINLQSGDQSANPYNEREEWYESNSTVCDLPLNIDPYDPIIKVFIRRMHHEIRCIKSDEKAYDSLYNLYQGKSLSFMNDDDGIVRIFRIREHDKSLKCLYQPFDRDGESDDNLKYFAERPIIGHKLNLEKIGSEFVLIKCKLNGKLVYTNIHSWPIRVPSSSPSIVTPTDSISSSSAFGSINTKPDDTDDSPFKPSVMFLIIESMSYLNYKRFMFKTAASLSKLSNHFILRGLNKLADNSYPNMMPILSGYRPYYGVWPFNGTGVDSGPYDEIPFIWDAFKAKNYTTGYIEDFPPFGLFNYLAKGFHKPPVDWYPRPFWLQIDKEQGIESLNFCYKQKPKLVHWLKQVKQFLNKATKAAQPFFLWSFYIQVTHKDFNAAQMVDGYIADFIDSYRSILEDTVFILMGDHGNRFGSSLETGYGQIETRMPLFSIHIPPKLLSKHPHLAEYLKKNEKKLTTWLDVREMLKDIVAGDYESIISPVKRNAYSVWREEIPFSRTCQDALIPMEFCLCSKRHSLPVNSKSAQEASSIAINYLNEILAKYISAKLCHPLTLKEILSVKNVYLNGTDRNDRIEVILSVHPSDAILQVQLYRTGSSINEVERDYVNSWSLEGDISRLNSYGNQSICIEDRVLRKYCYCRKESSHSNGH